MENVIQIGIEQSNYQVIAYNNLGIYTKEGKFIHNKAIHVCNIIKGTIPESLRKLMVSWGICMYA